MAMTSPPGATRGRRLIAAFSISATVAVPCVLAMPAHVGQAANASPFRSPGPEPSLTASPTPNCFPYDCPSPSPSDVVVSPVAPDVTPSPSPQPYHQGTLPSPSPSGPSDTAASPVPLGGGFLDELPTPSSAATNAPTSALAPHQGGLPLPFLAVGALLILGAIGSLIYALAPRSRSPFATARVSRASSPVMFTPYGPDASPGTTILSRPPGPGGPKKP